MIKYQDIVDFIQDPLKKETPNESVVICCMKKSNNPVAYKVTIDGPLDNKAGKKQGTKSSESCDFMSFGPIYTSLHTDLYYSTRNSFIPSWNVGVIKIWILRKECDAKTNRRVRTSPRKRTSKAWKPVDELNYILTEKDNYVLLIQRPGQLIRHYGKHVHCVIYNSNRYFYQPNSTKLINRPKGSIYKGPLFVLQCQHGKVRKYKYARIYTSFKTAVSEEKYYSS